MTDAVHTTSLTAGIRTAGRRPWASALATGTTFVLGRYLAAVVAGAQVGRPPAFDAAGELAAALVFSLTMAWVAGRAGGSSTSRTLALGLVAFASVAAVMVEGNAFAPGLSPVAELPVGLALQLGVSLLAVAVAAATSSGPVAPRASAGIPALSFAARILAAASVYVVAYLVTGAVSYLLVTGPYYATHAGGLVTPAPSTVLAVAVLEGVLLSLGTVPVARALGGTFRSRALTCGVVLSVLGGIVPLLQASSLPDVLRVASGVEIFFQKVPLGVAVVWLLAARRPVRTGR